MQPGRLNQWLTLCANAGVLVGILLLVLELQQNRDMMRAQTRTEITAMSVAHSDVVASDAALASILRRARFGDPLDDDEYVRYLYQALATLGIWEHMHYQYRLGLLDRAEYEAQTKAFEVLAQGSVGFRRLWCEFKATTAQEFRDYMNDVYPDLNCDELPQGAPER